MVADYSAEIKIVIFQSALERRRDEIHEDRRQITGELRQNCAF